MTKQPMPAAVVRSEERAGVVRFAADYRRQLQGMVAAGRIGAAEASALGDRVVAFADQVAAGLHIPGDDSSETRAMVALALMEIAR